MDARTLLARKRAELPNEAARAGFDRTWARLITQQTQSGRRGHLAVIPTLMLAITVIVGWPVGALIEQQLRQPDATAWGVAAAVWAAFGTVGPTSGWRTRRCWIGMQERVNEFVRPPVECDFCKGVDRIGVVRNMSTAQFASKYAFTGSPVVVEGATKGWAALEVLSVPFLQRLYTEVIPAQLTSTVAAECNFFQYTTHYLGVAELLTSINISDPNMQRWYVGRANCHSSSVKLALRGLYSRPRFLPPTLHSAHTDWLFMGSPGPGAHLHHDAIPDPSWQAQIRGVKRWELYPPPECSTQCKPVAASVSPGQVIVVDTHRWYHRTTVVGKEVSIAIGSEYSTKHTDNWDDYAPLVAY